MGRLHILLVQTSLLCWLNERCFEGQGMTCNQANVKSTKLRILIFLEIFDLELLKPQLINHNRMVFQEYVELQKRIYACEFHSEYTWQIT